MSRADGSAPAISAAEWLLSDRPISLEQTRERVTVLCAFQMLCSGCVQYAIPQARRIHEFFPRSEVVVLGLHAVFEHHAAQSPVSLRAFLHENRVSFPVAVDAPGPEGGQPLTLRAYGMQGTPTLVLIDRVGRRRAQHFGHVPDLRVGAEIATLLAERPHDRDDSATDPEAGQVVRYR